MPDRCGTDFQWLVEIGRRHRSMAVELRSCGNMPAFYVLWEVVLQEGMLKRGDKGFATSLVLKSSSGLGFRRPQHSTLSFLALDFTPLNNYCQKHLAISWLSNSGSHLNWKRNSLSFTRDLCSDLWLTFKVHLSFFNIIYKCHCASPIVLLSAEMALIAHALAAQLKHRQPNVVLIC